MGNTPEYNYDLTAFQVGTDLYRKVRADGSHEQAGISLSAGTLNAGVSHYTRSAAGEDTLRAYGIGAYWMHFGPSGWYLDGVLQVNRFDIEARPNDLTKLITRGRGYTSLAGKRLPVRGQQGLVRRAAIAAVLQLRGPGQQR